jgi:hypothetical protein
VQRVGEIQAPERRLWPSESCRIRFSSMSRSDGVRFRIRTRMQRSLENGGSVLRVCCNRDSLGRWIVLALQIRVPLLLLPLHACHALGQIGIASHQSWWRVRTFMQLVHARSGGSPRSRSSSVRRHASKAQYSPRGVMRLCHRQIIQICFQPLTEN